MAENGIYTPEILSPSEEIALYISNSGAVSIGTPTPTSSSLLTVNGNISTSSLTTTGTVQAGYFIGDGSQLTGVKGLWPTNGSNIYYTAGNVGIGISTPGYTLDVIGTIHANEVIVDASTTSDFVFDDSYKLPSLKEIETFVKQNKHLPDIASASEMKENGIKMNEMQIKLLQKK